MLPHICHILYPELSSAGKEQEDIGKVPWHWGQYSLCASGYRNTFLLMFLHTTVYRIYESRSAFMMAVTTLSLSSMIMLKKVVKAKLLVLFVAICTAGIIAVGYIFNIFHAFLL